MNEITWNDLSYELKACLGYLNTRFLTEVRSDIFEELYCLGLVIHDQLTDEDVLTDLGKRVLSQADTPPAPAIPQPADERPSDAGGRYRLRRWDDESEKWVDGVSQPWDEKENAIKAADDLAVRHDERYLVVDRLQQPVYDTGSLLDTAPTDADSGAEDDIDLTDVMAEIINSVSSDLDDAEDELESLRAELAASRQREAALRAALEFYANPKSYEVFDTSYSMEPDNFVSTTRVDEDMGRRAKEALQAAAVNEEGGE